MRKSIIALLHIGFWACYLFLLIIMLGILSKTNVGESFIQMMIKLLFGFAIVPSVITFYLYYFFVFPRYLQHNKILPSIGIGIIIILVTALLGIVFISSMEVPSTIFTLHDDFLTGIITISFITLVSGVAALAIKGFITWFEEIKLKETLKQKNHEMELALVKSQLDPHFLFNTINNINILILKNATVASEYLTRLSDIMRFMLFETKTDKILLSKEIEYVERYVELQKIRTSNTNYVHFTVRGNSKGKKIAPMVIIPFVENAFKHTNNKKLKDAIKINILIDKENINLECVNRFDPSRKLKQERNSLGNELIRKRLNLIYPEKHTLEIRKEENLYSVFLTINHEKIQLHHYRGRALSPRRH